MLINKFGLRKIAASVLLMFSSLLGAGQEVLSQERDVRLFSEGEHLQEHAQHGASLENFSSVLYNVRDLRHSDAQFHKAADALTLFHNNGEKLMLEYIANHPTSAKIPRAYFELGNYYVGLKNYRQGVFYYSKADVDGLSSEEQTTLYFRSGYALFSERRFEEALPSFDVVKYKPGHYQAAAGYYAGFIEYSNGNYSQALVDLRQAEAHESYKTVVPYMIAATLYKQGAYEELLKYADRLKDSVVSEKSEINLLAAHSFFQTKDYKNALKQYEDYFKERGSSLSGVQYRAGYSAFQAGEYDKAVERLKTAATEKDTAALYAAYYLGCSYLKMNRKELALPVFKAAGEKSPEALASEASHMYGLTALDLGKAEDAISEFESYLEKYPDGNHAAQVRDLLSQTYLNGNYYNKAIAYIESLKNRNQTINQAYQKATMLKGEELFNLEKYQEAIEMFQKSLAHPLKADYTAEASLWCAESCAALKQNDKAIPLYLAALKKSQFKLQASYGIGYAYFSKEDYKSAALHFTNYIADAPTNMPLYANALLRLADCQYVGKNYDGALKNYDKVIQLESPDADYAILQKAVILAVQSRYAESAQLLDRLIKSYPASAFVEEAKFQQAQMQFEQGNYEQAIRLYTHIISGNESSKFRPYAYARRAASHYNLKNNEAAANDYIEIVKQYPKHPIAKDIILPLQEALQSVGRSGEFEEYLAVVKTNRPDAAGLENIEFEAARNNYYQQKYEQAVKSLEAFLTSYPESTQAEEARYFLAESNYRLKNFEAAGKYYKMNLLNKTFSFYAKSLTRLAELAFKDGDYNKAVKHYRELESRAGNKKEQYSAWSGLTDAYFQKANYDSAFFYANIIISGGGVPPGVANRAVLTTAKIYLKKGDIQSATDALITAINSAADESGAEAMYLLAGIYFGKKKSRECYETLLDLNNTFASYPAWTGKGYLLMADNFIASGDAFQAEATLKSLQHFPLQEIRTQATEKLAEMAKELKEKQKQKAAPRDTLIDN